jgi:hypothetical protein
MRYEDIAPINMYPSRPTFITPDRSEIVSPSEGTIREKDIRKVAASTEIKNGKKSIIYPSLF